jgi:hypothetical protein
MITILIWNWKYLSPRFSGRLPVRRAVQHVREKYGKNQHKNATDRE